MDFGYNYSFGRFKLSPWICNNLIVFVNINKFEVEKDKYKNNRYKKTIQKVKLIDMRSTPKEYLIFRYIYLKKKINQRFY